MSTRIGSPFLAAAAPAPFTTGPEPRTASRSLARRFGALVGALLIAASPAVAAPDDPEGPDNADAIGLAELGGGYHIVDFETGINFGATVLASEPDSNGDYEIYESPLGPGMARAVVGDDTSYKLEFASGDLDLAYDPLQSLWSIPLGVSTLHLLADADVTVGWNDPYGPEVKVRKGIDRRTGFEVLQFVFCSGPALFGLDFDIIVTNKSCAYYDYVSAQGVVHNDTPVPAGTTMNGLANGGQPMKVDCSTVYCRSQTLGDPTSPLPSWGPAGGAHTLGEYGGALPNFARRLAEATGEPIIFRISVVTTVHVYFLVNDFVVYEAEAVQTTVFEPGADNKWPLVDVTIDLVDVTTPPDFQIGQPDLGAVIDFMNGGSNGAPAN
ncbi:MAG: hypothetical protein JNL90_14620 [Planctomycetes bacterium]|nr:hypothetical protein [Planctomycetota bacterium]